MNGHTFCLLPKFKLLPRLVLSWRAEKWTWPTTSSFKRLVNGVKHTKLYRQCDNVAAHCRQGSDIRNTINLHVLSCPSHPCCWNWLLILWNRVTFRSSSCQDDDLILCREFQPLDFDDLLYVFSNFVWFSSDVFSDFFNQSSMLASSPSVAFIKLFSIQPVLSYRYSLTSASPGRNGSKMNTESLLATVCWDILGCEPILNDYPSLIPFP
jgi:hypothetical protein